MTQATDIVRQALEFYANKESYMFRPLRENGNSQTDIIGSPIDEDDGERARNALKLLAETMSIERGVVEYFMPIRFLPMNTTNSRMLPFMLIQFVIGWSRNFAANTKQGAKGVMRVKSPVKSECKLIQIGL